MTTHYRSANTNRAHGYGGRSNSGNRQYRGGRSGGNGGGYKNPGARMDVSRFINKVSGSEEAPAIYASTNSFADFAMDERIKANIIRKGYTTPTAIQDQAIPFVLAGRDIVGIANTGTGKTGAFLIPLLDKLVRDRSARVIVIVPTRELAEQVEEEFRGFAEGSGFRSVCAVGGMSISRQIRDMRDNPVFVVGTPGRLKDLLERRVLDLSKFGTVVLDEADRMLDMGFIHDMKFLLARMSPNRHTLFFSATLSREIEALIHSFLNDPVRVSVKTGDTAALVHQDIVQVGGKQKVDVLHDLLIQPDFSKVLVFGRTKHGVEKLSKILRDRGIAADSIHGNKSQAKRRQALEQFKSDRLKVLVATDVAARGIDVADVTHVINFDLPTSYEDYVHRIGRTGRAGKRGKALTFVG